MHILNLTLHWNTTSKQHVCLFLSISLPGLPSNLLTLSLSLHSLSLAPSLFSSRPLFSLSGVHGQ